MTYADNVTSMFIVESLKHQTLLRALYQINKLDFSLGSRWIKRELHKPYFITDLRVGYGLNRWNFYVEGTNLLDASYKETAAVPMPGRWYTMGVRYHWKR